MLRAAINDGKGGLEARLAEACERGDVACAWQLVVAGAASFASAVRHVAPAQLPLFERTFSNAFAALPPDYIAQLRAGPPQPGPVARRIQSMAQGLPKDANAAAAAQPRALRTAWLLSLRPAAPLLLVPALK